MSNVRPFRDVKLQWLQQISCDNGLSDGARSIALYIITTHLNGHTEKAWPSYQTIADATGKSVKTIQRAIRELETRDWFEVKRGNGFGHNSEYRPSAASILRASDAREKTGRVVTLNPSKGGQTRPAGRSFMSGGGGQKCPPNPEKEIIHKPNSSEGAFISLGTRKTVPLVFVADSMVEQIRQWRAWLSCRRYPKLEVLAARWKRNGKLGFALPSYWPPVAGSSTEGQWVDFLTRRLDGLSRDYTQKFGCGISTFKERQ